MKTKSYKSKTIRVLYALLKLAFDIVSIPFKIVIGIFNIIDEIKK